MPTNISDMPTMSTKARISVGRFTGSAAPAVGRADVVAGLRGVAQCPAGVRCSVLLGSTGTVLARRMSE